MMKYKKVRLSRDQADLLVVLIGKKITYKRNDTGCEPSWSVNP